MRIDWIFASSCAAAVPVDGFARARAANGPGGFRFCPPESPLENARTIVTVTSPEAIATAGTAIFGEEGRGGAAVLCLCPGPRCFLATGSSRSSGPVASASGVSLSACIATKATTFSRLAVSRALRQAWHSDAVDDATAPPSLISEGRTSLLQLSQ